MQPFVVPRPSPSPTPSGGTPPASATDPNALLNALKNSGVPTSSALSNQIGGFQIPGLGTDLSAFGLVAQAGLTSNVWVGQTPANNQGSLHASLTGTGYRTIQDMLKDFYGTYSAKQISKLGAQFVQAGWISQSDQGDMVKVGAAYQQLLQLTATMNASGRLITPGDALKQLTNQALQSRPQSYSSTERDVNLTDPTQARQMLIQGLQNQLGRDPTPAEYQAFLAALHAAERQNPTVTTKQYKLNSGTGQYDITGTTTSGGVDPSAYTLDYSQGHNTHEHAAYQAATTYYDAMIGALKSVV